MKTIKNHDWMIAISAIIFGYLFYYQLIGVNYFIFSLIQLSIIFWISSKENRTRKWWAVAIGVVISATAALLFGSLLSALGCAIGLVLLSAITLNKSTSVVIAFFNSIYSAFSGLILLLKSKLESMEEATEETKPNNVKKNVLIIATTALVGILFFALYRQSNVQFKEWTDKIDLSFISFAWILFTLMGYYFIYLMYRPFYIKEVQEYDQNAPNELQPKEEEIDSKLISTNTKLQWGVTLLITLNVLLLSVNITDIVYFLGNDKNETTDYSLQVHQGIDALIFSIILAITVILYFFGGSLNFISGNKRLRQLAQFCIIQNVVLIGFTALRNVEYVEAFFLTYKRIGVFIYLICCIIGLFFTFIKINRIKTNWFLVRKVSWTIYFSLFWTPLVNWDSLIINYNFNEAENNPKALDISYLLRLPKVNVPLIEKRIQASKHSAYFMNQYNDSKSIYGDYSNETIFLVENDWRSFNVRSYRNGL